jgi:alcohol dehydrogenase (cytochrome c)
MQRSFVGVLALAAIAAALTLSSSSTGPAQGAAPATSTNWLSWGRTLDQNRHSPLRQITRGNIGGLGRIFNVDFRQFDAGILRGQQSFPLIVNGRMYVTTADNNVFALDATNGRVLWRYKPANTALFANFGIRANRGVAYCAGRLFLATLDMHLVALNARNGRVLRRVPVASGVPGASSNYGYQQTSAPICAKGRVLMGAAGSEYGIRGYVMAWRTDLTPAWANPYWTVPPEQTEWRRRGRLVGGGAVWTPVTVDPTTNTVYFGTGSATPLYHPGLRPGPAPRTDSLIALDLFTGRQKWWQQQMSHNEWAYDTAQPPLVYTARVGGKRRRIVSVATMEGVWFAYDARTGRPIYQRVKVLDRVEHPALKPGRAVVIFPSSLGGLNYSPASFDPRRNLIINAAAETAAVLVQKKLTPTQRARKLIGDVFLGLENSDFGALLPGWHNHGSISAIDVNTGRRVWKFRTPEPERGGVTTTASGIGFAGGGDGVLRAFDTRTGRLLWRFQTGNQIAGGPSIYSVRGKQYIAITVGGTPTSSGGGTATRVQVFALGGSKDQSPPPDLPAFAAPAAPSRLAPTVPAGVPAAQRSISARTRLTATAGGARIFSETRLYVRRWQASGSNEQIATGRLLLRGAPVSGARIRVDRFVLPGLTNAEGRFRYRADVTVARRHVIAVVGVARATVNGRRLSAAARRSVLRAKGGFNVSYRLRDVRAKRQANGTVLVTGRATLARGTPPPAVVLFTYRLSGRITDAEGRPVAGASVVTRTLDRDFWTFSQPSDARGRYASFFTASDEAGADPVPLSVQVALGQTSYAFPAGRNVLFKRLRSATMDIRLPAAGGQMTVPTANSFQGGIYDGLLVGVSSGRRTIRPLAATWPDRQGRFRLLLPASARGKSVSFWMDDRQVFSRAAATPGGRVNPGIFPSSPRAQAPQGLMRLRLPR